MIHSIIHKYGKWYYYIVEMLIPICIGKVQAGYSSRRRLDKMLPVGHRRRGYED